MYIALATTLAAVGVAASALPTGTYRYALIDDGKQSAVSTISITHGDGVLTIDEDVALSGDRITTTRTFDPTTFSTLSYRVTVPGSDEGVDITDAGATYHDGATTTTFPRAVAGPAVALDFFVGPYVALPAMVAATSATAFNVYCVCLTGFAVSAATVARPAAQRPQGVPATDVATAVTLDDGTLTMWYDPATYIVRELYMSDQRMKFVLQ